MNSETEGNIAGLGVKLYDGQATLSELRAIRSEMRAIVEMSRSQAFRDIRGYKGGRSGVTGSSSNPNQPSLFGDYERDAQNFEKAEKRKTQAYRRESQQRISESRSEAEAKRRYEDALSPTVKAKKAQQLRQEQVTNEANKRQQRDQLKRDVEAELAYRKQIADRESKLLEAQIEKSNRDRERIEQRAAERSYRRRQNKNREIERRILNDPNITDRDLSFQRKVFRNARTRDPELRYDRTSKAYRDDFALDLLAQRRARQYQAQGRQIAERRLLETQLSGYAGPDRSLYNQINAQQAEAARQARVAAQQVEANRQAQIREDTRRLFARNTPEYRSRLAINERIESGISGIKSANTEIIGRLYTKGISPEDTQIGTYQLDKLKGLRREFGQLQRNLNDPLKFNEGDTLRKLREIEAEMHDVLGTDRRLKAQLGSGAGGIGNIGGAGGAGGGGYRRPGYQERARIDAKLNRDKGLLNPNGLFPSLDVVGRITRNILLYEVVSQATYGLTQFIGTSLEAAKVADQTAASLSTAAERAGENINDLFRFAEGIRAGIGASRENAQELLSETALYSGIRSGETTSLAQEIADIAGSRGIGGDKVAQFAEQLRRRESKFTKRQFGVTVEEIYRREAERLVRNNYDRYIPGVGDTPAERRANNLTFEQRVRKQLSEFSEEDQGRIYIDFIREYAQRPGIKGKGAEFAQTDAGKLITASERLSDLSVSVGQFILSLKPLGDFLQYWTTALNSVSGKQIIGTGPGGTITQGDITSRGSSVASTLKGTIESLYEYSGEALYGIGTLSALGLIGRRRATRNRRYEGYQKAYKSNVASGLSAREAENLALEQAGDLRGGIFNSIRNSPGTISDALLSLSILGGTGRGTQESLTGGRKFAVGREIIERQRAAGVSRGSFRGRAIEGLVAGAGLPSLGGLAGTLGIITGAVSSFVILGSAIATVVTGTDQLSRVFGVLFEAIDGGASITRKSLAEQEAFNARTKQVQEDLQTGRARFQRVTGINAAGAFTYDSNQLTVNTFNELRKLGLVQEGNYAAQTRQDKLSAIGKYVLTRSSDEEALSTFEKIQKFNAEASAKFREQSDALFEEREQRRRAKEERDRQERINDQARALQQLRQVAEGSFRIVEETGSALSRDNPYVKVFADGETAALRMQQQWGFLNDTTREYFENLERKRIEAQLTNLRFDTAERVRDLNFQRADLEYRRNLPGLSRTQQHAEEITNLSIESINRIAELNRLQAQTTGSFLGFNADYYTDPRYFKQQLADIQSSKILGLSFGGDLRSINNAISGASLGLLQGLSPQQINNDPFLRDIFLKSVENERQESRRRITDEIKRAGYSGFLLNQLSADITSQGDLRDRIIRQGGDAELAQERFDKYVINRTAQFDPKDLRFDQFQIQQEALRRDAEREIQREEKARQAVEEGLSLQTRILEELQTLRQGVLDGDVSILVQVLNDTQARVDQKDLEEADGRGFNVPLGRGRQVNPYSGSFARYKRGGNTN